MLNQALAVTTIAVTDLERAKGFYGGVLALQVLDETPFAVRYGTARGSQLSVRRGVPNVDQTVAHFEVSDIEASVKELSERGVRFEDYESPKTEHHIATIGPARGAWFKDPDGNVLGLREGPVPGEPAGQGR
jgi:catechol 2,3-dioxygenase-like lactoylglutathione lyase family enzyme